MADFAGTMACGSSARHIKHRSVTNRGPHRSAFCGLRVQVREARRRSGLARTNAMAPAVTPDSETSVGLNPVHKHRKNFPWNFKYSIHRRFGS